TGRERPEGSSPPAPASKRPPVTVACEVEGISTVIWLRPAGSLVKKGDVLCELDPSRGHARLRLQPGRVDQAVTAAKGARLAREAAELARSEFEALSRQEREQVAGEVDLAATAVELARARLTAARDGSKGPAEVRQAERDLARAEQAVEDTRRRLERLLR